MIYDTVKNRGLYVGLHEGFQKAFEFIKEASEKNFAAGRYELNGENLYASVQEYTTKPEAEGSLEGHEKYIDIQYIVSGSERIDVAPAGEAAVKTPYNAATDVAFYKDAPLGAKLILRAGEYAVFFPADLHKPGLAVEAPEAVKKIVVKVKI